MTSWHQLSIEQPDLARALRARLVATKHHILATLRHDGSPRVSGSEVQFHGDDVVMGMMFGSRKGGDLRRDGRFALHANPGDGSMDGGDAKLAGIAHEVTDPEVLADYVGQVAPPQPFQLFRLDLRTATLTSLHPAGDRLVIETWHPGAGILRVERA